jgi:two-component system sensor histidine kinase AlgZ
MKQATNSEQGWRVSGAYLPDFCSARMAFAAVLIAELVALLLALARPDSRLGFWSELASVSLVLLWIALGTAGLLCVCRNWINSQSLAKGSAVALAIIVLVPLAIVEAAYLGGQYLNAASGGVNSALFPSHHLELLARTAGISLIVGGLLLRYFYISRQWRNNVQNQARARIDALQARIRPHFLFNSMNTIAALTRSDPRLAEEAVQDLSDLFRATLAESNDRIPLKQELEVARIYQRIEALRLGERLQVSWRIEELPLRALVPGLCLQPLLENAIYHGIEALPEGGQIIVQGSLEGNRVVLEVRNPLAPEAGRRTGGNRMALENIRQRMELAYSEKAGLSIDKGPDYFSVRLEFPYTETPRENPYR